MGSENSKFIKDQPLPHEYRPIVQQPGVYRSVLSGNKILKHKIELNSEAQINYEKDVFVFRRMNADRVISAFFFQNFAPTHFCNMSYQVCFFTEYPCSNFTLGTNINIQKTFKILIECLRGFELLFQKFGAFSVGCNNIFFNNHMETKVWISSDLGKTKLEKTRGSKVNQMEMIKDIFRLFDKIKDERSYQINFSNFLKKILEKQKILSFKNVINYMVDEASKYFISRARKNQNPRPSESMAGFSNNLLYTNRLVKETKNQLISLKSRNRNYSKNSCSSTGYHFGSTQIGEGSAIAKNFVDKSMKSKRHNSQQDCKTRQINYFKTATLEPQSNFHRNENGRIQLITQSNTLRVNRKSLDQIDKNMKVSDQLEENKTKRVGKNQQAMRENLNINVNINGKRIYQIVATQIDTQKIKGAKKKENWMKTTQVQSYLQPKHVIFEQVSIMQKNSQLFDPKVEHFISPIKGFTQSNMVLSNLETLKSILHSQYSEMDSQIRNDLQNLDF